MSVLLILTGFSHSFVVSGSRGYKFVPNCSILSDRIKVKLIFGPNVA